MNVLWAIFPASTRDFTQSSSQWCRYFPTVRVPASKVSPLERSESALFSFSATALLVLPYSTLRFGPSALWTVYRASQRPSLRRVIVASPTHHSLLSSVCGGLHPRARPDFATWGGGDDEIGRSNVCNPVQPKHRMAA